MPFIGLTRERINILEEIITEEFGYSCDSLGGLSTLNVWFLNMLLMF